MNRLAKRLLVEGLGYSSCSSSNHRAEYVRLSAAGLIDREDSVLPGFGVRCSRVMLTDKGIAKAREWLNADRSLAPDYWKPVFIARQLADFAQKGEEITDERSPQDIREGTE